MFYRAIRPSLSARSLVTALYREILMAEDVFSSWQEGVFLSGFIEKRVLPLYSSKECDQFFDQSGGKCFAQDGNHVQSNGGSGCCIGRNLDVKVAV